MGAETTTGLAVRAVDFSVPDDFDPMWHRELPELACVANAVSLLMPAVEPYVVRSIRSAIGRLPDTPERPDEDGAVGPDDLAARARAYVRQESQHHREHQRFNRVLLARHGALRPLERASRAVFATLERRTSPEFGVAFAAGFEAVAYSSARWVESHLGELFGGADPRGSELFLWHLAEEVEHKDVARAVFEATDGSRWRYARATVVSLVLLGLATISATTVLLAANRRLHRPVAWARLVRWSFGYVFELLPDLAAGLRADHRPADFVDPAWFALWLTRYPRRP